MIKITLKDGSIKEIENKMSILDIAKSISEGLARMATAGEVNGEVKDLRYVVEKDCALNILTFDNNDVQEINQGAWEEYIVKCPVCGTHIQVCYVNGSWR